MNVWKPVLFASTLATAMAVDVLPSKSSQNQPEKFMNPNSSHFSIFAGDPARIQKANSVDFSKLEPTLKVEPAQISVEAATATPNDRPNLKVTFLVKNTSKTTYTLSFPDVKRFDVSIKNPAGQVIYVWSADKEFTQVIGDSRINPGERDSYFVEIDLRDIEPPLQAGVYVLEAVMANYPEIICKSTLTVGAPPIPVQDVKQAAALPK